MHDDHHLPDTVGGSAIRHTFFTTMGVQEIQHVHVVLLGGVHHWHHASFVFMIDVLRASVLIQKFHQCHMAVLGRQCHVGRGMVLGTGKSFPTQKNGGQSGGASGFEEQYSKGENVCQSSCYEMVVGLQTTCNNISLLPSSLHTTNGSVKVYYSAQFLR